MNPKSASALVWGAAVAALLGLVIMSPSGRFFSLLLATALATAPALFAPRRLRIAGGVILACSIALAWQGYPAFDKEMADYRERAAARSGKAPAAPAVQQQDRR